MNSSKRKRITHRKSIIGAVSILGAISVAGLGFSSWIINATEETATSEIGVTVAGVTDHRYEVKAAVAESDTVSFNAPPGTLTDSANDIIRNSFSSTAENPDDPEDLNFSVTLTITSNDTGSPLNWIKEIGVVFTGSIYNVSPNTSDPTSSDATANADYIRSPVKTRSDALEGADLSNIDNYTKLTTLPTTDTTSGTTATQNGSSITGDTSKFVTTYTYDANTPTVITIKFDFTFGWGKAFGWVNPCYTNVKDATSANYVEQSTLISNLKSFSSKSFTTFNACFLVNPKSST